MATSIMINGDASIPSSIHATMNGSMDGHVVATTSTTTNNTKNHDNNNFDDDDLDEMSIRLHQEALDAMEDEPELTMLLKNTVLAPGVRTFEEAVASTITYRLLLRPCNNRTPSSSNGSASQEQQPPPPPPPPPQSSSMMFCPSSLRGIISKALHSDTDDAVVITEAGHTMAEAVRKVGRRGRDGE